MAAYKVLLHLIIKKRQPLIGHLHAYGGEYRIRTGDLLHAMQALYQLS